MMFVSARPALCSPRFSSRIAQVPVLGQILKMTALHRSRRALAALEDHQLADIGLTRFEAQAEAKRALWDAPHHWLS